MNSAVVSATQAVEKASGIPVLVQADDSMAMIARVVVARDSAPAHLVLFNPKYGEATDYHVVFQCGFVLRIYQTPPELRFNLVATDSGRRDVARLVADHLRRAEVNLPEPASGELSRQLYDGLCVQLRSIPVGMRVDRWIRDTHPTLAEQQKTSALRQLAENQRTLSPRVAALAPERVYDASVGMTAALAAFWGEMFGDATQTIPYKVGGHSAVGGRLLGLLDGFPPEPASDRDVIDAWGAELGVRGWYALAPTGG